MNGLTCDDFKSDVSVRILPRFGCGGWCSVRCWQESNLCGGDYAAAGGSARVMRLVCCVF